ncbi:MAG: hypothetical protein HKN99_09620 [Winogradskyella sp.]|nr:hypothetical protein [Winogradskyella sp.]MBT8376485.1 hypothetical protein [Bacteroidia bacterium]NNC46128.1 hypothetical protein [Winogradskyella sp.]NNL82816.1 hypothetical protein [Winogradskyella sp.]
MSENKTGKYLKYAIGEIVLVVIGILIALQINNWNNSKTESKILNSYAQKISLNLRQDLDQIEDLTTKRNKVKHHCKTVNDYYRIGKVLNKDTLLRATVILYENKFSVNKSGFNSLVNSGSIEKLPNGKFSDDLYEYYELVEELNFIESKYNLFCETMEYKLWEDGLFDVIKTLNTDNEVLQKQSLAKLEKFKTFKALFSRSPADINLILNSYEKLDSLGNKLILEIEKTSF